CTGLEVIQIIVAGIGRIVARLNRTFDSEGISRASRIPDPRGDDFRLDPAVVRRTEGGERGDHYIARARVTAGDIVAGAHGEDVLCDRGGRKRVITTFISVVPNSGGRGGCGGAVKEVGE